MKQEVTNFSRFYSALNDLPSCGDREEFKRSVVREFTWNRTDSLREMKREEYNKACESLEKLSGRKDKLKKKRSECLKLMQRLGIDTTDWARINNFCQHPRIAGKPFARISLEEMGGLATKLRSIERSGGLKEKKEVSQPTQPTGTVILCMNENTLLN